MKAYKIISENDGVVLVDKKCIKCGVTLRLEEHLDYIDKCHDCHEYKN